MGFISNKGLRELKVNQPVTEGNNKLLIPIEVEIDTNWKPTKAKDIPLIVKYGKTIIPIE